MKPGIKTSEFWITIAVVILTGLMAGGVLDPGSEEGKIAVAILGAIGAGTFTVSRGLVKAAENNAAKSKP